VFLALRKQEKERREKEEKKEEEKRKEDLAWRQEIRSHWRKKEEAKKAKEAAEEEKKEKKEREERNRWRVGLAVSLYVLCLAIH
jgi:hypothetical protein